MRELTFFKTTSWTFSARSHGQRFVLDLAPLLPEAELDIRVARPHRVHLWEVRHRPHPNLQIACLVSWHFSRFNLVTYLGESTHDLVSWHYLVSWHCLVTLRSLISWLLWEWAWHTGRTCPSRPSSGCEPPPLPESADCDLSKLTLFTISLAKLLGKLALLGKLTLPSNLTLLDKLTLRVHLREVRHRPHQNLQTA